MSPGSFRSSGQVHPRSSFSPGLYFPNRSGDPVAAPIFYPPTPDRRPCRTPAVLRSFSAPYPSAARKSGRRAQIRRPKIAKTENSVYLCRRFAEIAQSVEHQLPKLRVTGSNPAFRSRRPLEREQQKPLMRHRHIRGFRFRSIADSNNGRQQILRHHCTTTIFSTGCIRSLSSGRNWYFTFAKSISARSMQRIVLLYAVL